MYAVQPHGINGAAVPETIEDMAAERLRSILEIQPAGPYSIGGFCGGAIIAYEVARQLVARGERVDTVLLIDATPPNLAHRSCWTLAQRIGAVLRLSPRMQRALFLRLKWYREDLRVSGRAGLLGWTALLGDKLKSVATRSMGSKDESGVTLEPGAREELKAVWKKYHQRMSIHVPGAFPGRVVLLRSNRLDGQPLAEALAGWRQLASGVEVHHIPGDHHTCVTTHAPDLAASMRPYLQG
jgi:thioesterase domain-containing protein